VRAALEDAPKIGESLCAACREHFEAVRSFLDGYGIEYELVPTLVRGLDYYTRTVFEFIGPEHGAQSAICAGGRYDGLIEEIGGAHTPGVGFGAGIERLLIALEDAGIEPPAEEPIDVFFARDEGPRELIFELMARLRAAGRSADTDYAGRSLKGQLTQAGRLGARTTVVVGAEAATIRTAGERDVEVPLDRLAERLSA
jgi:histidyl-tRNA synthetase